MKAEGGTWEEFRDGFTMRQGGQDGEPELGDKIAQFEALLTETPQLSGSTTWAQFKVLAKQDQRFTALDGFVQHRLSAYHDFVAVLARNEGSQEKILQFKMLLGEIPNLSSTALWTEVAAMEMVKTNPRYVAIHDERDRRMAFSEFMRETAVSLIKELKAQVAAAQQHQPVVEAVETSHGETEMTDRRGAVLLSQDELALSQGAQSQEADLEQQRYACICNSIIASLVP